MRQLTHLLILPFIFLPSFLIGNSPAHLDPSNCDLTVNSNLDIELCGPNNISLDGVINGSFDDFVWSQDGLPTSFDLQETVFVDQNSTFTLKATFKSPDNIIVNGDFESGDSGFTTDYDEAMANCTTHPLGFLGCEGVYYVMDNPMDGHTNFDACSDNGSGGTMMVVNGAPSLQQVWCQEVCVEPDGRYVFTSFAASVNPVSPAILQFSIDGDLIGNTLNLSGNTCDWEMLEEIWEASGQSQVEICVTNQNTAQDGNDFALDDISFFRICEEEASFDVTIKDVDVYIDQPIDVTCFEPEVTLILTATPAGNFDVLWNTFDGNIVDEQNGGFDLVVDAPGVYFATITDDDGCEFEAETEVFSDLTQPEAEIITSGDLDCSNPEVTLEADSNISGAEFSWLDEEGNFISDLQEIDVTESGTYQVIVTDDDNGCTNSATATVSLSVNNPSVGIDSIGVIGCTMGQVTLTANMDVSNAEYVWLDENGQTVSTINILNVTQVGTYSVTAIDPSTGCMDSDEISVTADTSAPVFQVTASGALSCVNTSVQLSTNSSLTNIVWREQGSPDILGMGATLNVSEIGFYTAEITNALGCTHSEPIEVEGIVPTFQYQTDFTPFIDCNSPLSQISLQLDTSIFDFDWPDLPLAYADSLQFMLADTGTYHYVIIDDLGCTLMDSLRIEGNFDTPSTTVAATIIDCVNNSSMVNASDPFDNLELSWTDSQGNTYTGDQVSVPQSGLLNYTVSSINGCTSTGSITIEASNDFPIVSIKGDTID